MVEPENRDAHEARPTAASSRPDNAAAPEVPAQDAQRTEAAETALAGQDVSTPEPAESGIAAVAPVESAGATGPFVCRLVTVDIPGTTANLGAGFDALAMALDISNRITVERLDRPIVELAVEGFGAGELVADRHNRFVLSLELGLRWALGEVPAGIGWRISMRNGIPFGRGLGSSAAAAVAGLVAADAFTGGRLDVRHQLALATELEGHPDNSAAALLGGFVAVTMIDAWPEAIRFDVPRALRAVVFVPERVLHTTAMRAALPPEVPRADAVFNVGRAALSVAAIASGHYEYLRHSTEDRLHQPYRAKPYPEFPELIQAALDAGAIGACLSGSGSTVIAFADEPRTIDAVADAFASAAERLGLEGSARVMAPRNAGAIVVEAQ